MQLTRLHGWDLSPREGISLQRDLAGQVMLKDRLPAYIRRVAGVDVSYRKHGRQFFAAVVALSFPELEPVETATATSECNFPYVPGLLSFRELPVVLAAFARLGTVPDLVLVDGQGVAHPRRIGLASHLGLWLDLPTIGCAKSRLIGEHAVVGEKRGDWVPLLDGAERIGSVVRTRDRVKPMYISPGHLVSMKSSVELVLACTSRYRMPEPTRLAHHETNRVRREWELRSVT